MPALIQRLNGVQDLEIEKCTIPDYLIGNINRVGFEGAGTPAEIVCQISLADISSTEPETPFGWQHFHSNVEELGRLVDENGDDIPEWMIDRNGSTSQGGQDGEYGATQYPAVCKQQMNTSSNGDLTYRIMGLDPDKTYDLEFFGAVDGASRPYEPSTGQTQWKIGSEGVAIYHKDYVGSSVHLSGISPFEGMIEILVHKIGTGAYWYFNVLVIRQYP